MTNTIICTKKHFKLYKTFVKTKLSVKLKRELSIFIRATVNQVEITR